MPPFPAGRRPHDGTAQALGHKGQQFEAAVPAAPIRSVRSSGAPDKRARTVRGYRIVGPLMLPDCRPLTATLAP